MPPSWRPEEGGLISVLVYSTPASSLVFLLGRNRGAATAEAKHCSLQASLKLLPQKLAVCVSAVGPKCSSQAWTYIYDTSNPLKLSDSTTQRSKLKSVLAALPGSAGASTLSASFRETEK